jgi:SAM-dependent methyltransferase
LETAAVTHLSYAGFDIPEELINLTGAGADVFIANAEGQLREVRNKVGYEPDHNIVEIGCGVGRFAIPLADHVGNYLGVDIIQPSIDWATNNITRQRPNFRFVHYDVKDDLHNPSGTMTTKDIRLPVADGTVDRVILWSVFTHLFRPEIEHYLREFRRILKPDGKVWASCFVITPEVLEAAQRTNLTQWDLRFENPPDKDGCYINNLAVPRGAVGYSPAALIAMAESNGLMLAREFYKGQWSGHYSVPESGQDGMVLVPRPAQRLSIWRRFWPR